MADNTSEYYGNNYNRKNDVVQTLMHVRKGLMLNYGSHHVPECTKYYSNLVYR